jgi:HPt (histidine-containing phosphotransfer) domain-containing protein
MNGPDQTSYTAKVPKELEYLIPEFLSNRANDFDQLQNCLESKDIKELERIGHTLKGVCAAYGFGHLSEIGKSIEFSAKDEKWQDLTEFVQQYHQALKNTKVEYV